MIMLPDLLKPNLKVVFCGTAAGSKSAEVGFYYAGPGNKFWKTLFETGFTSRLLMPSEFKKLVDWDIGLTDMVKDKSGMDSVLSKNDFKNNGLVRKITKYKPLYLCFNGKKAAKEFYGVPHIEYGLQEKKIKDTKIFVVPSTSGAANGFWNIHYWKTLSKAIKK